MHTWNQFFGLIVIFTLVITVIILSPNVLLSATTVVSLGRQSVLALIAVVVRLCIEHLRKTLLFFVSLFLCVFIGRVARRVLA